MDVANPHRTDFLKLNNTRMALRNAGLQQKLLFNCSLRVMHARAGGGARPGAPGDGPVAAMLPPKSITELFMCRNRQTNAAVVLPAPTGPDRKAFLQLESMHPAAGGGGSWQAHPNYPYLGHLYPMVCDSTGSLDEAPSGDPLHESSAPGHTIGGGDWDDANFANAAMGDTFVGDPFDWEWGAFNGAAMGEQNNTPQRDRLQHNSGVEIDLITEMRYVRQNQAAHGLDAAGFGGITLADMMPSEGELAAPGDHFLIFTLYPGNKGQRFVDASVPEHYNAPVAGCHIVAEVHINRPSENLSSADSGDGEHYGETREVYNVLGHG